MDPLTALALASNVVAFVDFSSKLVSKGYHIYTSAGGALAENIDLEAITVDLSWLTTQMTQRDKPTCATRDQQALDDLVAHCTVLANQLVDKLEKLRVVENGKHRKWKSFRQALKTVWNKSDLDEMAARLASFRSQLDFHILVSLKADLDLVGIQNEDRFLKLDQNAKDLIQALAENRAVFAKELNVQNTVISGLHRQTEMEIVKHVSQARNDILEALTATEVGPENVSTLLTPSIESQKGDKTFRENAILLNLGFPSLYSRYMNVTEAHSKTFNWIFEEPVSNDITWSSFTEWLKGGESIYWIYGKAGSGKSTLMKYICEDRRTPQLLSQWSNNQSPVLMAAFFFWMSGTPDQASQIGLVRSLLHDILSQRRDLLSIVFADQWNNFDPALRDLRGQGRSWTLQYAKEALKRLLKLDLGKVALFIDGLDEYCGDHTEIIELFQSIESTNVKFCLSSRPLIEFQDAFNSRPKLKLQDLTYKDVTIYVNDKLAEDTRYKALCVSKPLEAPKLVREIVTQADGVFLWVTLVIKSLLSGLRNKDQVSDLQKRLKLIPTDILALYHYMLAQIEPLYFEEGSRIFQLMNTTQELTNDRHQRDMLSDGHSEALCMLGLSFAVQDQSTINIHAPIRRLSKTEVKERIDRMDHRLRICCAGLLEMGNAVTGLALFQKDSIMLEAEYGNRRVEYLHRSTKDFLDLPEARQLMFNATQDINFNPNVVLLQSALLRAKAYEPEPAREMREMIDRPDKDDRACLVEWALMLAHQAEQQTGIPQLDEFDRTVSQLWPSKGHYANDLMRISYQFNPDSENAESKDDFLSMAVIFNLRFYTEAKLQEDKVAVRKKVGRPYLYHALVSPRYSVSNIDKGMVELLITHGSSPNDLYDGATIWASALNRLIGHEVGRHEKRLDDSQRLQWIQVLKFLLDNGADVHERVRRYRKRGPDRIFSVPEIITECFADRFPEEAAELLALVQKLQSPPFSMQKLQFLPRRHRLLGFSKGKTWLEKKLLRRDGKSAS